MGLSMDVLGGMKRIDQWIDSKNDMTLYSGDAFDDYLIGGLAGLVSQEVWDAALDNALGTLRESMTKREDSNG